MFGFGKSFVSNVIDRSAETATDRRALLKAFGLAGVGAVGVAALGGLGEGVASASDTAGSVSDASILNFALNLEYLEAEFYQRAVTGQGLDSSITGGKGTRGKVSGGKQVPFQSKVVRQYGEEIAKDELEHVKFLRSALGSAAVAEPAIDVDGAFTAAARAAGVIGPDASFDAYANDNNFLLAAFVFEDVGVTAYKGAAPLITSKTFLSAAAGILAVEAYHAANIRTTLFAMGQQSPDLITMANKISAGRGQLDNGKDRGIEVAGTSNIVPADDNALAFGRTPGEVLNIVYLSSKATTKGGFFPEGVNGALNTSATGGGSGSGGSGAQAPSGGAGTGGGGTADGGTPTGRDAVVGTGAALLGAGAGVAAMAARNRSADEVTDNATSG